MPVNSSFPIVAGKEHVEEEHTIFDLDEEDDERRKDDVDGPADAAAAPSSSSTAPPSGGVVKHKHVLLRIVRGTGPKV